MRYRLVSKICDKQELILTVGHAHLSVRVFSSLSRFARSALT